MTSNRYMARSMRRTSVIWQSYFLTNKLFTTASICSCSILCVNVMIGGRHMVGYFSKVPPYKFIWLWLHLVSGMQVDPKITSSTNSTIYVCGYSWLGIQICLTSILIIILSWYRKRIQKKRTTRLVSILTLPPYQRKGYGKFLIALYEYSFHLTLVLLSHISPQAHSSLFFFFTKLITTYPFCCVIQDTNSQRKREKSGHRGDRYLIQAQCVTLQDSDFLRHPHEKAQGKHNQNAGDE